MQQILRSFVIGAAGVLVLACQPRTAPNPQPGRTPASVLDDVPVPVTIAAPACEREPDRLAERIHGSVSRGETFSGTTPTGWLLRLVPVDEGWRLEVTTQDRENEDLSRLTPPWHFVPNPRHIEGWHFRNAENTGPNDGTINAPQELREFIFSPAVGRELEYRGSATAAEDVEKVSAFGRGWLFLESYRLTPPGRGERATFESLTFSACLTWPGGLT